MEPEIDHYRVLGLPSGEEGAKLTFDEIKKAYKSKALELHPDKRLDDPKAQDNFQKLRNSYDILQDDKARKLFDDLMRAKRETELRQTQRGVKRKKMVSDLERREQESFAPDPVVIAREEEERIKKKLQEEIARIRAMHSKKNTPVKHQKREREMGNDSARGPGVDKERMLKVTWDVVGQDYSATRLKELFQQFGEVEDVVIRSSKKKGSALVVLASEEAAIAALGCIGDLANPLLVFPVKPTPIYPSASDVKSNLVGASYQAFENSVLEKLAQAAKKQKET
ncbi:hypothetical protein Droror1_Dr00021982 [Drosera rotundifolia]